MSIGVCVCVHYDNCHTYDNSHDNGKNFTISILNQHYDLLYYCFHNIIIEYCNIEREIMAELREEKLYHMQSTE